jgi:hypothetical protein
MKEYSAVRRVGYGIAILASYQYLRIVRMYKYSNTKFSQQSFLWLTVGILLPSLHSASSTVDKLLSVESMDYV